MPLQKLPVQAPQNANQWRRSRETLNQILDHTFDDSRVQTAAEIAAGVMPINKAFPPGDIRRYGALVAASDNSAAINSALSVSANGGDAAFLPLGTWKITSTLSAAGNCSMLGVGSQSIIAPQACDGIDFPVWGPAAPTRRVFSGFSIVGTGTNGIRSGIVTTVSPGSVYGITFSNISIVDFRVMVYASGFRWTTWTGIVGSGNFYGFYFIGQNTNTEIFGCHLISSQAQVQGDGSWGISFQQSGGDTTQGTEILGTYVYGYDIGINVLLAFETQIIACDISQNLSAAVQIQSTNGGFWLQSCWVEAGSNPGAAPANGVVVTAITPTTTGHVLISDNYINATTVIAGSIGISLGNSNNGAKITGNKVIGFDKGINLGASTGLIVRDNTVNCVTSVYSATSYGINIASTLTPDLTLGPNYIVGGTPVAATMTGASANIGVPSSAAFPVGTPVQFDATINGFSVSVTYYVVTSAANVITVSATPGGGAINATGNTAVNVFQAPLPFITGAGNPGPGFQFFGRGSFIGTISDPAVSGVIDWAAYGYGVSIEPRSGALTGTGTTTTMTMTGIPSLLYPLTPKQDLALVSNNTVNGYGTFTLSITGVFTVFWTPAGTVFTIGGTKSLGKLAMKWLYA